MDKKCSRCPMVFTPKDGRYTMCEPCRKIHTANRKKFVRQSTCLECGTDITHRDLRALRCFPCAESRNRASMRKWHENGPYNDNQKARAITHYAVKVGFLPHPENFKCTDCTFRPAKCYDHRDYRKPLEVEPVCIPCNSSRGRGEPLYAPYVEAVNQ